jgi:hypothetical protein
MAKEGAEPNPSKRARPLKRNQAGLSTERRST